MTIYEISIPVTQSFFKGPVVMFFITNTLFNIFVWWMSWIQASLSSPEQLVMISCTDNAWMTFDFFDVFAVSNHGWKSRGLISPSALDQGNTSWHNIMVWGVVDQGEKSLSMFVKIAPGHNGWHFTGSIFKCIPWLKICAYGFKFHWRVVSYLPTRKKKTTNLKMYNSWLHVPEDNKR